MYSYISEFFKSLIGPLMGESGWALIYMPLMAGLIIWPPSQLARLQTEVVFPARLFSNTMTEFDGRLEGLETAVMGLQAQSQHAFGELRWVRTDLGAAAIGVRQVLQAVHQMKQQVATSGETWKDPGPGSPLSISRPNNGKRPAGTSSRVSVPTPASATVPRRVKRRKAIRQPRTRTNFRMDSDLTKQP